MDVEWENQFEESVIKNLFGDRAVLARKFDSCIQISQVDEELEKLINKVLKKYYEKKDKLNKNKQR